MPRTKLLLLDDHELFRVMLGRLLNTESSFSVVAECSSIDDALEAIGQQQVDLVVLDHDLGERATGLHFIERSRRAAYKGRILLVTAGMSNADYLRAMGLGVCGIFLKHSSPDLLVEAIHKVMAGETWIDQRCIRNLIQSIEETAGPKKRGELSERERQVLKRVFGRLTNKEIASGLAISEPAVKSVLQQLFVKTGVRTRSQLVRVVLEEYGADFGRG